MSNYLPEFLTLAAVHLMAVASPGPDFAITLKQTLRFGKQVGVQTAWGIGTGILLHVSLCILGFAVLIQKHEWAQLGFQWIGGLYLAYLGIMSLRAKPVTEEMMQSNTNPPSKKSAFLVGLGVNALNVKALLFFLSVFTAIVSVDTPVNIQIGYGLYLALATALWFSLVANLVGHKRVREHFYKHAHWIERVVGIFLLILAYQLITH